MDSILAISLLLSILMAGPIQAQNYLSRNIIRRLSGPVEVKNNPGHNWLPARTAMNLTEGCSVRTLQGGRCEIELAGRRTIRLEGNSSITIPVSKYNTNEKTGIVDLLIGKLWAKIQRLTAGDKFFVRTPNALGGVKGTIFWVEYDNNKETNWALMEGRLRVSGRKKTTRSIVLSPGQSVGIDHNHHITPVRKFRARDELRHFYQFFTEPPVLQRGAIELLPEGFTTVLNNERKLLSSIQRLTKNLNQLDGSHLSKDDASRIIELARQILERSQKNRTELDKLFKRSGGRSASATASSKEFSRMHSEILHNHQQITQRTSTFADTSSQVAPVSKEDITFLRRAIQELRRISRRILLTPKNKLVPPRVIRRFSSIDLRTSRRYGKLKSPGLKTRALWRDYMKTRSKVMTLLQRRPKPPIDNNDDGDFDFDREKN